MGVSFLQIRHPAARHAVESGYANAELTTVRAMVAGGAHKDPARWDQTLALIDQMLAPLK